VGFAGSMALAVFQIVVGSGRNGLCLGCGFYPVHDITAAEYVLDAIGAGDKWADAMQVHVQIFGLFSAFRIIEPHGLT
jgi:hypothetical protein